MSRQPCDGLQLTSNVCIQIGIIEAKIHDEVGSVEGINEVIVEIDHQAEWLPSVISGRAQDELRSRRPFSLTILD